MEKMPLLKVIGSTTAMLLVAGSCWAHAGPEEHASDRPWVGHDHKSQPRNEVANKESDRRGGDNQRRNRPKAPEIDAGAGGGALALLVGGLLLAAEKRRRSL